MALRTFQVLSMAYPKRVSQSQIYSCISIDRAVITTVGEPCQLQSMESSVAFIGLFPYVDKVYSDSGRGTCVIWALF